ncbi:MAG TPA: hypothetical protein VKY26_02960, partial [Actinomycetota bacterium]|nr:hypothetical protein [Actinomycetota bacterium]
MFFWYLGAGCVLLLITLGPRRIDYRLALVGLLLPLIDIPIRLLAYPHSRLGIHLYGHTFLFALVLALAIQFTLRGARARKWFVLPMGIVAHLLLAGMLADPIGLFWPLLGTHFTKLPAGVSLAAQILPLSGFAIAREALGLAALVYIAFAFGLDKPGPRRDFLAHGTLSTRRRQL